MDREGEGHSPSTTGELEVPGFYRQTREGIIHYGGLSMVKPPL